MAWVRAGALIAVMLFAVTSASLRGPSEMLRNDDIILAPEPSALVETSSLEANATAATAMSAADRAAKAEATAVINTCDGAKAGSATFALSEEELCDRQSGYVMLTSKSIAWYFASKDASKLRESIDLANIATPITTNLPGAKKCFILRAPAENKQWIMCPDGAGDNTKENWIASIYYLVYCQKFGTPPPCPVCMPFPVDELMGGAAQPGSQTAVTATPK